MHVGVMLVEMEGCPDVVEDVSTQCMVVCMYWCSVSVRSGREGVIKESGK